MKTFTNKKVQRKTHGLMNYNNWELNKVERRQFKLELLTNGLVNWVLQKYILISYNIDKIKFFYRDEFNEGI